MFKVSMLHQCCDTPSPLPPPPRKTPVVEHGDNTSEIEQPLSLREKVIKAFLDFTDLKDSSGPRITPSEKLLSSIMKMLKCPVECPKEPSDRSKVSTLVSNVFSDVEKCIKGYDGDIISAKGKALVFLHSIFDIASTERDPINRKDFLLELLQLEYNVREALLGFFSLDLRGMHDLSGVDESDTLSRQYNFVKSRIYDLVVVLRDRFHCEERLSIRNHYVINRLETCYREYKEYVGIRGRECDDDISDLGLQLKMSLRCFRNLLTELKACQLLDYPDQKGVLYGPHNARFSMCSLDCVAGLIRMMLTKIGFKRIQSTFGGQTINFLFGSDESSSVLVYNGWNTVDVFEARGEYGGSRRAVVSHIATLVKRMGAGGATFPLHVIIPIAYRDHFTSIRMKVERGDEDSLKTSFYFTDSLNQKIEEDDKRSKLMKDLFCGIEECATDSAPEVDYVSMCTHKRQGCDHHCGVFCIFDVLFDVVSIFNEGLSRYSPLPWESRPLRKIGYSNFLDQLKSELFKILTIPGGIESISTPETDLWLNADTPIEDILSGSKLTELSKISDNTLSYLAVISQRRLSDEENTVSGVTSTLTHVFSNSRYNESFIWNLLNPEQPFASEEFLITTTHVPPQPTVDSEVNLLNRNEMIKYGLLGVLGGTITLSLILAGTFALFTVPLTSAAIAVLLPISACIICGPAVWTYYSVSSFLECRAVYIEESVAKAVS